MPTRFAPSASLRRSFTRTLAGAAAAVGLMCANSAFAAGTGLLNDTGQTLCDNGSNVMATCTVSNKGDAATYKRQDGRFGRDRAGLAKVGGGVGGVTSPRSALTATCRARAPALVPWWPTPQQRQPARQRPTGPVPKTT